MTSTTYQSFDESDKRCITFAGAPGSSKTPIANYLSTSLGLPVLNNDAIRIEVTEDRRAFDTDEYDRRQTQRCKETIASGRAFIYDASVDRKWSELAESLQNSGYQTFITSLDLSYQLLVDLYAAKQYSEAASLPDYIAQHEAFLQTYGSLVRLAITDQNFDNRLNLALSATRQWMAS